MAFGYEYWIVYLPEFNPHSFLLFVHNPAGSTRLRDYCAGRERVLGQPRVGDVRNLTEWGLTRFEEKPHTVSGPDGERYWQSRISDYNRRCLRKVQPHDSIRDRAPNPPARTSRIDGMGRARRGSQRQLQDYVNLAPSALDHAIISALPAKIQQNSPTIRWVSPLACDQYREFRDTEFLSALGMGHFSADLNAFWPGFGPCWDALGVLTTSIPLRQPISILVESKSHVPEIYGSGCQAGEVSRPLIEKSLNAAKNWCGARADADWAGPAYQSANRIAHLYFIRQRLNRPCLLVNLYFIDDPYRPTSQSEWSTALKTLHDHLGITNRVPGLVEVFLPAIAPLEGTDNPSSERDSVVIPKREYGSESGSRPQSSAILPASTEISAWEEGLSFPAWCRKWQVLGDFQGSTLPDTDERIKRLLELWTQEIPGRWQRGVDPQLLRERYRRGDLGNPHPGGTCDRTSDSGRAV